jgi:Cu2+-exporting ATPase
MIQHQHYQLEGVRCARCIQAIESALHHEPSVQRARVNMSTNRLLVVWDGAPELAEQFAQKVEALGYKARLSEAPKETGSSETRFLMRCMAIAGFGMGNIMLISFALWTTGQEMMGIATRDILHWLSALIALPVIAYAGQPFFRSAMGVLMQRRTNMDVPISLALILACAMSVHETIRHAEHVYFDSAVMLVFFLLIGRFLDAKARGKARAHAEGLLAMMQGNATIITNGKTSQLPIRNLVEGMHVHIAVGEKIPADAVVYNGASAIDMSLITGETAPHAVAVGDTVYSGTLNLHAPLICEVQKPSKDSTLAEVIRLMETAEQSRSAYVRLADRAAQLYTPVVHSLALAAFCGWFFWGGMPWQDALLIAITTLIITCPCALGLAVPVVQVLATGRLMRQGIMVKSGDALERLATIDTAVFDKTGTLTLGSPQLISDPSTPHLQLAASLAAHSKHPYSHAITRAYEGTQLPLTNIREIPGDGVYAEHKGDTIALGNHPNPHHATSHANPEVWLSMNAVPLSAFRFNDPLKDDAASTLDGLRNSGIAITLLSGDRDDVVKRVAHTLSVQHWHAKCTPETKLAHLRHLQHEGHRVLMVGDGINDAPSMAQATVSMSPATGMDITQNSADIVFRGTKLMPVMRAWQVARNATRLVQQNFALALCYNCLAIPLAVAGYVTPLVAAVAMSGSSLIVIANSFRIHRNEAA